MTAPTTPVPERTAAEIARADRNHWQGILGSLGFKLHGWNYRDHTTGYLIVDGDVVMLPLTAQQAAIITGTIAAALAAAREEGWRAGLEEAAKALRKAISFV